MRSFQFLYLCLALLFFAGCMPRAPLTDFSKLGPSAAKDRLLSQEQYLDGLDRGQVSFVRDVQPIVENRCVVCHGCYDAPCQLKLEAAEGMDRGGSKLQVYATRAKPMDPTRLYMDARNSAEWRTKGFHPVLNERGESPDANLDNSVLAQMLLLKKEHPQPVSGVLPETFDFRLDRELQCPTSEEFARYAERHPLWGMPYGLPPLKDSEYGMVLAWVDQGARYPGPPPLPAKTRAAVERWEAFMNGPSPKERLMARYLYEHLFMGHLHFEGDRERQFFRLVRSKTPPGQPVDEIAAVRPYDDPGRKDFYYRLQPLHQSIVDKNHLVYEIGERRMRRIKELFFQPGYKVDALPGYDPEQSANPFRTFAALPPKARYRFLLDDAHYFISGFMKGPVCRGQVALNVIRDRFWVVFYDPEKDAISNDAAFLEAQSDLLRLPSEKQSEIGILEILSTFPARQVDYLRAKQEYLVRRKDNLRNSLEALWDGGRHNPDAALTAFRHFDSASLSRGFVGDLPLTAWAIDYPLLERIHYLLVAGFNVFGGINHQAATRLFMDYLRNEAENNFISFLPASARPAEYRLWNRGWGAELGAALRNPYFGFGKDTAVAYKTKEPRTELFALIEQRLGAMAGPPDRLNRCAGGNCDRPDATPLERRAERDLRALAKLRGGGIRHLPELSYILIHEPGRPEQGAVYSLVKNEALLNVSFMFRESSRRVPDEDTLTVVPGFVGSYPNYFFDVEIGRVPEFVERILRVGSEVDAAGLSERFGVRRTNAGFWDYSDFFNRRYRRKYPITAGLFDLNRYENR
jgi:hypothetical protein